MQGDIVGVSADAVVHPTNSGYSLMGEVGTALGNAGGSQLIQEVNKLTSKGTLPACNGKIHILHCYFRRQALKNLETVYLKSTTSCLLEKASHYGDFSNTAGLENKTTAYPGLEVSCHHIFIIYGQ